MRVGPRRHLRCTGVSARYLNASVEVNVSASMAITTTPYPSIPAINQVACGEWTVQDNALYHALPHWFHEKDVKFRKRFGSWTKIFGKVDWAQNMGKVQEQIITEPPPIRRQHAFGKEICAPALVDITQFRERVAPMYLIRQKFRSPAFCWCPHFHDFIKNKVNKNLEFVLRDQQIFVNLFLRSALFHWGPTIMLADGLDSTLLGPGYSSGVHYSAPADKGNDAGTGGKSLDYLETLATLVGNPGNLSMRSVIRGCNILSEDLGAVPYQEGSVKENSPLDEKFLLITSPEAYDQFADDPLYKENRSSDEDAVRQGFHGLIRNRVTCQIMSEPLRLYIDPTTGNAEWPEPQTIIEDPNHPNFGQTVPSPKYRSAQYEFAVLLGDKPADIVNPGAPPAPFGSHGMEWNGRPYMTDEFLVECASSDGNSIVREFNTEKEWLKIYSQIVSGFSPTNMRNALIIMFKRKRNTSTFLW